jgi:hypothetical protein
MQLDMMFLEDINNQKIIRSLGQEEEEEGTQQTRGSTKKI